LLANFKRYGFVTTKGKVIKQSLLEELAIKAIKENSEELDTSTELDNREVIRPYSLKALARLLEENTPHRRACDIKSGDIAGGGYDLRPKYKDVDENQKEEIIEWLEAMPDDINTVFKEAEFDYQSFSELYIEIVREGRDPKGKPLFFNHLPTVNMTLLRGKNIAVEKVGTKKKYYKKYGYPFDVDKETGKEYPLGTLEVNKRANEFFYDRVYNPLDKYYGFPYILSAIGAIVGDIAARNYNNSFFENYGVPAYAILVSGDYDRGITDPNGYDEIDKRIQEQVQSFMENPHSVLVLTVPNKPNSTKDNVEIKFEKISDDIKEASFSEFRKMNKQEILDAHGVPAYLIGDNSESVGALGGNNSEQAVEIYKRTVVEKRQNKLERFINKVIKDAFGAVDWEFRFANIDQVDENAELDRFLKIMDYGGATVADLIKNFGHKFGLEATDELIMNARFRGQQIINLDLGFDLTEQDVAQQVQEELKQLKQQLLEAEAKKRKWF